MFHHEGSAACRKLRNNKLRSLPQSPEGESPAIDVLNLGFARGTVIKSTPANLPLNDYEGGKKITVLKWKSLQNISHLFIIPCVWLNLKKTVKEKC